MLSLSQSHLTLLEACPRKYQYVFLEGLGGPIPYDQSDTAQWGNQFHLLMQQQALNLPVAGVANADAEMAASLAALTAALPADLRQQQPGEEILAVGTGIQSEGDSFSQSEHRRTLVFNGYLLTVVYDLLRLSAHKGEIYDWKTHQRPPEKVRLQQDWQTRLYLYVLCETTALSPEALSMTYWFVRLGQGVSAQAWEEASAVAKPGQVEHYQFKYSSQAHQRTYQDLLRLTGQLSRLLAKGEFPKVPLGNPLCDRCMFNLRCDRLPTPASPAQTIQALLKTASELALEEIEEIPLDRF